MANHVGFALFVLIGISPAKADTVCRSVTAESCLKNSDLNRSCPNRCQEKYFEQCCLDRGLTPECAGLCTHKAGENAICLHKSCAVYLNPWFYCGNRGVSAEDCCRRQGLPEHCLDLCNPSKNYNFNDMVPKLSCIKHSDVIQKCKRESNIEKGVTSGVTAYTPQNLSERDSNAFQQMLGLYCSGI